MLLDSHLNLSSQVIFISIYCSDLLIMLYFTSYINHFLKKMRFDQTRTSLRSPTCSAVYLLTLLISQHSVSISNLTSCYSHLFTLENTRLYRPLFSLHLRFPNTPKYFSKIVTNVTSPSLFYKTKGLVNFISSVSNSFLVELSS